MYHCENTQQFDDRITIPLKCRTVLRLLRCAGFYYYFRFIIVSEALFMVRSMVFNFKCGQQTTRYELDMDRCLSNLFLFLLCPFLDSVIFQCRYLFDRMRKKNYVRKNYLKIILLIFIIN